MTTYRPGPAGSDKDHDKSADRCAQHGNIAQLRLSARGVLRNMAEPSWELSIGDAVSVGEAALTVERAGWAPKSGDRRRGQMYQDGRCRLR